MTLNIELLESSFAQIKGNSSEFTAQFYRLLFADYPEVQPLFVHTNMEAQGKKLFQSLVLVVNNLLQPDVLSNTLKGLGTQHLQYGVLPQHYPMVGSSLLKAFEATLGTAWTPDVQQAWTEAYGAVAQLMLDGANYSPEQVIFASDRKIVG
ncbi:MAG: flavohemoprotein [Tildeniella nuda ZEHNDER 1965/U140]|nr:flavohemoprotein [Tildeniella nuda ZEHNDER 1965/U140]